MMAAIAAITSSHKSGTGGKSQLVPAGSCRQGVIHPLLCGSALCPCSSSSSSPLPASGVSSVLRSRALGRVPERAPGRCRYSPVLVGSQVWSPSPGSEGLLS